jgi:tRNA nucleotidyltransferase (CCA-adding enzyme)
MAMSIDRKDFGRLVDLFGGRRDLCRRLVRSLHDKSFVDDPTRIFRAARFENRLGFKIEGRTKRLIISAIKSGAPDLLDTQRVRKEVLLILKEARPLDILESLAGLYAEGVSVDRHLFAKALIERLR